MVDSLLQFRNESEADGGVELAPLWFDPKVHRLIFASVVDGRVI